MPIKRSRTASMKVVAENVDFARITRTTTIPAPPSDGCVRYVPPFCDSNNTTAPHSSPKPSGSSSLPYTASPFILLLSDIVLFIRNLPYLLNIIFPIRSVTPSKPDRFAHDTDELTFTRPNMFAFVTHVVLFVVQIMFILSLGNMFFLPFWIGLLYVGFYVGLNFVVSVWLLNGTKALRNTLFVSEGGEDIEGEKWVFINGVAVGSHWMQMNLERIAICFGRRVYGVHNATFGITFDVIECVMQRCFGYNTQDVRTAFSYVKRCLSDENCKKLVLMCHSQGGLEASLVVDMLLAECGAAQLSKLEVYTFGCAGNHFNSPSLSEAETTARSMSFRSISMSKASIGSQLGRSTSNNDEGVYVDSESDEIHDHRMGKRKCQRYAIRHIEHYSNSHEFVARWGVLSFAGVVANRYAGAMFERRGSGHLMNQHYLANMFALEQVKGEDGEVIVRVKDANEFMDAKLVGDRKKCPPGKEEEERPEWEGRQVKEFSRLWEYRNGGSPDDSELQECT